MPPRRSSYTTSRAARFIKLGTLSGKVGSSYAGQALRGAFVSAESKTQSLLETNARNALRVARTFGELKGAVMKVGQMLSLQEDLLPAEVRDIINLNRQHWKQLLGYDAPADDLFLKRTFVGMFGNLIKLRARVPVHELLCKHLAEAPRPDAARPAPERDRTDGSATPE
jgi:hypothetical protein